MTDHLNFEIKPVGRISRKFLAHNISTFEEATLFVRRLPYGRNRNKADLTTLFADNCGTCSTKHALLKQLSDENQITGLSLIMGIFRMNPVNTPGVSAILKKYDLGYIPEAHNYLKWKDQILDFTRETSESTSFEKELIEEIEMEPAQITDFKIAYHKRYLANWLNKQPAFNVTLEALWKIREECIANLSGN